MGRDWIVKGDSTSHGGTVLDGDSIFIADGKPVARVGDPVACPRCKGIFPIVSGSDNLIGSNGQKVARQGDTTACGATLMTGGQIHGTWRETSDAAVSPLPAPEVHETYDQRFRVMDDVTKLPLAGRPYRMHFKGQTVEGFTDQDGYTHRLAAADPASIRLEVLPEGAPEQ